MWDRSDSEDGHEAEGPVSPQFLCGLESELHSNQPGAANSFCGGRRHSTVSDSGDTGIGTFCSDSAEDDSCSSSKPLSFQLLTQHHLDQDDDGIPTVHVTPSPSSSSYTSFRTPSSRCSTGHWSSSCQLLSPAMSPLGAPNCLDMKDTQPIRRWSSLTKLSYGNDKRISAKCKTNSQGSLDRGLLRGSRREPLGSSLELNLPLSPSVLCQNWLLRSPGAEPCCRHNRSSRFICRDAELPVSPALSSPVKLNSLDTNVCTSLECKWSQKAAQVHIPSFPKQVESAPRHQPDGSSLSHTALRTQMWLAEQMEYRPNAECVAKLSHISSSNGMECCGADGLLPGQQGHLHEAGINQVCMGSSSPVNTLVKVNEGLLRCKELEIDRQKQQILQLHARIRENELRAQQVLQSHRGRFDELSILHAKESAWRTSGKEPSDEDIRRKLAGAEQEVLRLKEFFQQVTKKYTEDMRRLQEKIKTRDRYISSLKKKYQRESEQNRDKQQRIETLEKYLCDLPTLNDVASQSKQQDEVQHKAKVLQRTLCRLQKSLDEGCALIKEKNVQIELQAKREEELITAVLSLQTKVQQCLDDGVRLPMLDLKQLEVEHTELLQQQDHSCRLIESHKEQIERLTAQLKRQQQGDGGLAVHPLPHLEMPKVGRLLKEMSLCLLDLQALCSILSQRAQGKEPSLSLLLGMKSSSVCVEESDCRVELEDGLRLKLLEVSQLRRDIDELRNSIPHPNP